MNEEDIIGDMKIQYGMIFHLMIVMIGWILLQKWYKKAEECY